MTNNLHPSQLHDYLKMYSRAKITSWGCLVVSVLLLSIGASSKGEGRQYKPWLFGGATAALLVGRSQRKTVKDLGELLGDVDRISKYNFQFWIKKQTSPAAQLTVTVPAFDATWQPDNLITDPVSYIQQKQKHVALIGGTGDGKSTFTQYLSSKIGGRVIVYDSDAKPDDWIWLDKNDVVGRKGNFKAINEAMGDDLETLEELVQLRGDRGDKAISGRERFLIAEEFPILVDECDNAPSWLKKHAKRGRRYKQFVLAIAQNDTAENFGLQGDKDTLYSCFCLVRLGSFGYDYARTKLKDDRLEQWLKAGGKKRFMLDDQPCELDLSNWGIQDTQLPPSTSNNGHQELEVSSEELQLNEYEQSIIDAGKKLQGDVLKARTLKQQSRLFASMSPEDIRLLFLSLADRGVGEVVGTGNHLGWRIDQNVDVASTPE
ncbi:MAG: type IV secretory system conjugative DNA transfer family protein [Cyanobacteria bacterium J06632_19]